MEPRRLLHGDPPGDGLRRVRRACRGRRRGAHRVLTVERLYREHFGRAIAALIRAVGDWDLAEEAVQDAFAAAVERWPRDGVPRDPAAWVIVVARNRAVDRIRRERALRARLAAAGEEAARGGEDVARGGEDVAWGDDEMARGGEDVARGGEPGGDRAEAGVADERLRLIFACCHPALAREAQVALTLRLLGGLTTAEVARAFLVAEPTMAQRLARAKAKIRDARIPFRIPSGEQLPSRVQAVLDVVCLIYNEGYAASAGDALVRRDLCAEALRLSTLLEALMPGEPEALGLHALLLALDARRDARVDGTGALILLEDQDPGRWDRARIEQATRLAARALRMGPPNRYTLQAAIAVEHAHGSDWTRIAALYSHLAALRPDPVVELNRAVAIALAGDLRQGLARIDALAPELDGYHYLHAARADLLRRLHRDDEAADAYAAAARLAGSAPERAYLERRRTELG